MPMSGIPLAPTNLSYSESPVAQDPQYRRLVPSMEVDSPVRKFDPPWKCRGCLDLARERAAQQNAMFSRVGCRRLSRRLFGRIARCWRVPPWGAWAAWAASDHIWKHFWVDELWAPAVFVHQHLEHPRGTPKR